MKRLAFCSLFLLFVTLCLSQNDDRPNIIFILTDDQRWDAIGHAGNDIIYTPHMDTLASQSTYFHNAFVTSPICAASRASILTGMYERTHDYTFGTPPLKSTYLDVSYPQLLKDAGYQTGFFGKLGVNMEDRRDTILFDTIWTARTDGYFRLQGPGGKEHIHLTDLTTNHALAFLDQQEEEKPFCLSISYNAPHADDESIQQYFWPERNDHLYEDVVIPAPKLNGPEFLEALPGFVKDSSTISRMRWHWRYDSPEKYQRMVKGYYRMISTIDDNLGRLRKRLIDLDLAENTIIILMGDNGYFLGERSLAGKWLMYDNSLRVPLMIYDPMVKDTAKTELALNIDITPTILDYAGISMPVALQGRSLCPRTIEDTKPPRSSFHCEHHFNNNYIPQSEGTRTLKWKYIRYIDHPEVEELYDLEIDPMETNNLAHLLKYKYQLNLLRTQTNKKIEQLEMGSID